MPNVNEMMPSKYIKKEDVGNGVLYTITEVEQQDVGNEETGPDIRWTVKFQETEKPLILNKTNLQAIANAVDSPESDDWIGKQVVLYDDPNVQFKGKVTGGVRVRAPKKKGDELPF